MLVGCRKIRRLGGVHAELGDYPLGQRQFTPQERRRKALGASGEQGQIGRFGAKLSFELQDNAIILRSS